VQYYALPPNSPEAIALKARIVALSRAYGVISPFTSFTGGGGTAVGETGNGSEPTIVSSFELLCNYPNPFNPSTIIKVQLNIGHFGPVEIRIYSALGELVRTLTFDARGKGTYDVEWDGKLRDGSGAASGTYIYVISIDHTVLASKMMLLK
jgi:hypothetical protein